MTITELINKFFQKKLSAEQIERLEELAHKIDEHQKYNHNKDNNPYYTKLGQELRVLEKERYDVSKYRLIMALYEPKAGTGTIYRK